MVIIGVEDVCGIESDARPGVSYEGLHGLQAQGNIFTLAVQWLNDQDVIWNVHCLMEIGKVISAFTVMAGMHGKGQIKLYTILINNSVVSFIC